MNNLHPVFLARINAWRSTLTKNQQHTAVPLWQIYSAGEWADWLENWEPITMPAGGEHVVLRRKDVLDLVAFLRALGIPHHAILEMEVKP